MSGSAKTLQKRFTEIRRRRGRAARLAAAVMSAVMAVSMLAATAAMAAIGADGLEYWDKDEIYLTGGMSFDINISSLYVPEYLKTDVAGDDGNIHCEVKNYDYRYTDGVINSQGTLSLSGGRGTLTMALQNGSYDNGIELDADSETYKYLADIRQRTGAEKLTDLNYAVTDTTADGIYGKLGCDSSEQTHWVTLFFAIKDNRCTRVIFSFAGEYVLTSELKYVDIGMKMDSPAVSNVVMSGTMADMVTDINKMPYYSAKFFSDYERDFYKNLSIEGFNVSIIGANENDIAVRSDVTYPGIDYVWAKVYDDENGTLISQSISPTAILHLSVGENYIKGKTYRVELAYMSKGKIVYRWMGYATIE